MVLMIRPRRGPRRQHHLAASTHASTPWHSCHGTPARLPKPNPSGASCKTNIKTAGPTMSLDWCPAAGMTWCFKIYHLYTAYQFKFASFKNQLTCLPGMEWQEGRSRPHPRMAHQALKLPNGTPMPWHASSISAWHRTSLRAAADPPRPSAGTWARSPAPVPSVLVEGRTKVHNKKNRKHCLDQDM